MNARFAPYKEIETDAVFGLDEDALLTTEEVRLTLLPPTPFSWSAFLKIILKK